MTQRLYLNSQVLTADTQLVSCVLDENGRYAARLKATPFHPKGGGQLDDSGWINDVDVLQVLLVGDDIIHYVREYIAPGNVTARVNAQARQHNTQLHSAGHLIGHVTQQLGWQPVKAHHWPGEARVVFQSVQDAPPPDCATIQAKCDQLIAANLPGKVTLRDDGYREVSFGELAPYPCGGTHVTSLGEIGGIVIASVQLKKGQLSVQYAINH